MKSNKATAIIFYLCAVVFYILAAVNFFGDTTRGMGVIWLCVGSMWLCLGSAYLNKSKDEADDSDSDDEYKIFFLGNALGGAAASAAALPNHF